MTPEQDLAAEFGAMEFFLLALIAKAEVKSLYAFQRRAGLEPGGIRPALRRLEHARCITRAESGARRRRDFSLTGRGINFLNQNWTRALRDYPDGESVLRAACVALLMNDLQMAEAYLQGMADGRQSGATGKFMDAERLKTKGLDPLNAYAWMRALTEAQRRDGESHSFSQLGQFIKEHYQQHVVPPEEVS